MSASSSNNNPGCLGSILSLFGITKNYQEAEVDGFPFRLRDDFLSPAEKSFYQVVKNILGDQYTICPKVSLADIFYVVRPNENRSAFNRINRKHVDYLVCNPQTMEPEFAIELDDSSHQRSDRMERDAFVDGVFEAADLPLLHVPAKAKYNTAELRALFEQALLPSEEEETTETQIPTPPNLEQGPLCPKCGTPMIKRTAKSGSQVGKSFYGCSNYPKCREILPVEV